MRNRFAHGFEHDLSLGAAEFAATLNSFRLIRSGDDFLRELMHTLESPETVQNLQKHLANPRRKFVSAIGTLALLLSVAREHSQPPVAKSFELVPLPQQELTLNAGEVSGLNLKTGEVRKPTDQA